MELRGQLNLEKNFGHLSGTTDHLTAQLYVKIKC